MMTHDCDQGKVLMTNANVVYCGDGIEGMKALADRSVDVVMTDPPYSEHTHKNSRRESRRFGIPRDLKRRKSGAGHAGRATEIQVRDFGFEPMDDDLARNACEQFARIVKRWVIVFTDAEHVALWVSAFEDAGLEYMRTGAWIKPGAAPQFSGDRPAAGFECLVLAHPPGRKHWNGGGRPGVWRVPRAYGAERSDHPTQKPLVLMQALVADFTDLGEIVCDPFAGSGTTLVAAKRLGRRAIGWELQPKYVDAANRRITETKEQFSTLSEPSPPIRNTPLFPDAQESA